jgi:V/A-type H+-transporting ATPase subunit E
MALEMVDEVMRSLEENIESLSRAMISEAKTEAEQIRANAQAKADEIRQRAVKQAEAERGEILERARQEADRLRGQVIATTQMKARTLELEHREKLLVNVFQAARQQISSIEQWGEYNQIAHKLLGEAVKQLGASKVQIRTDEITQKVLVKQGLELISKELGAEIILGKSLPHGLGVISETIDGHLQFDNTLETRLDRLQNGMRSPVYRILIGETL